MEGIRTLPCDDARKVPMAFPLGDTAEDLAHWYDRAAVMRLLAQSTNDVEAGELMLKLASKFDRLGDRSINNTPNSDHAHGSGISGLCRGMSQACGEAHSAVR